VGETLYDPRSEWPSGRATLGKRLLICLKSTTTLTVPLNMFFMGGDYGGELRSASEAGHLE